jgi:hypothetical protein
VPSLIFSGLRAAQILAICRSLYLANVQIIGYYYCIPFKNGAGVAFKGIRCIMNNFIQTLIICVSAVAAGILLLFLNKVSARKGKPVLERMI